MPEHANLAVQKTRPGWPVEFVKAIAQNVAYFWSKLKYTFAVEKVAQNLSYYCNKKTARSIQSPKRRKFAQEAKIRPIWSPCPRHTAKLQALRFGQPVVRERAEIMKVRFSCPGGVVLW
jgi:hypothetical protein